MQEYNFFKPLQINEQNIRKENLFGIPEIVYLIREGDFLRKRIVLHHGIYDHPIKGICTENLWSNILNKDLGLGEKVDGTLFGWRPESHKVGADIIVPSLSCPRIQIKTGQIKKIGRKKRNSSIREDHRIVYSSHRLTSHDNLQNILSFLANPHCDITFLLSPHPKYGKYYWIVLENLNFQSLDWSNRYSKITGKHTGWLGQGGDEGVINSRISTKLSSQLWVELKLSSKNIIHMEEICVY